MKLLFAMLAAALVAVAGQAQTNVVTTDELRETYQKLEEQQQATLRAVEAARTEVEVARTEAQAAAQRNSEALDARLRQLEQANAAQRERDLAMLQSTHRFTVVAVILFAAVGMGGIVVAVLFLVRISKRPPPATALQPFGYGFPMAAPLAPTDPALQANTAFLGAVDRLDNRIQEMESAVQGAPVINASTAPALTPFAARSALLLGKGQALLNLQQPDSALPCFEEVIRLDPANADAFVKKGSALEKLGRLDEAIECYDRAIALDQALTMAYLCKGGVFNRLERYTEALQCYEQALRAQEKHRVS